MFIFFVKRRVRKEEEGWMGMISNNMDYGWRNERGKLGGWAPFLPTLLTGTIHMKLSTPSTSEAVVVEVAVEVLRQRQG